LENDQQQANSSILNDPQILKHFISLLNDSESLLKVASTADAKLLIKQLTLHILKSLSYLINLGSTDFLKSLKDIGLLDSFVSHLYKGQSSESKAKDLIPVEWLELKCTEIKKKAMENDTALIANKDETTASILNKKQIVIQSTDP